jgi:hypothetical protein
MSVIVPNPFNDKISVSYSLDRESDVELLICDLNGKIVKNLFNGRQEPGKQEINQNVGSLVVGSYYLLIKINGELSTKKLIKVE